MFSLNFKFFPISTIVDTVSPYVNTDEMFSICFIIHCSTKNIKITSADERGEIFRVVMLTYSLLVYN